MPRIKVLPENLANMIAAGEIIDRPASVVKELVENAIDAGSDTIEVHLSRYGKEEIKVIDNGCGMGRHDALLAFERHATSKIREPEDLHKILTLGFRGEALPSIASVARLSLVTRERGAEIGTQVILDGGKLIKVSEIGAPLGTCIQVFSLFKNIPARLKFMKSDAVEFNHITQILYQEAIDHYRISFTLRHNGKTVWYMPAVKTLAGRIQQAYGYEIADHLLEINGEFKDLRIQGLIGKATYTKPNRFSQYTYVNNRFIRSPILLKAVSEGYSQVLPRDRFPVFFLFLGIPPEEVDVNVHPAKIEVRFSNQQEVFEGVVSLIRNRLATSRTTAPGIMVPASSAALDGPQATVIHEFEGAPPAAPARGIFVQDGAGGQRLQSETESHTCAPARAAGAVDERQAEAVDVRQAEAVDVRQAEAVDMPQDEGKQDAAPQNEAVRQRETTRQGEAVRQGQAIRQGETVQQGETARQGETTRQGGSIRQSEVGGQSSEDSRQLFLPVGDLIQLDNSFILFETRLGLVIVDQHAAHERVRYEQLQQEYRTKTLHSQRLLVPITFEMPGATEESAKELLPRLHLLGFDMEHFGHDTFIIKATPLLLAKSDPSEVIQGMFDDFSELSKSDPQSLFDELLKRMACSSAIKANHRLSKEEMRSLIEQLRATSMPFRCPHGRPTTIHLDLRLLEKHFQRT
ncbi:MAG: DNA mismatch repair endonuclease MutL [bacterium]